MPPVTSTGFTSGALYSGVQMNQRAYCYNGRNRMRVFDGVTFRLGGITTPSGSITAAIFNTGTPLTSTTGYFYYAVPVNSKHLIFGLPSKSVKSGLPMGISNVVTPTGAAGQGVRVSGIPTHADAQVDYWYIFRNKSGEYTTNLAPETQPFYYVGRVANGTAFFDDVSFASDDSMNDATLMDFKANVPPCFKHGFIYNDVMYGYGFDPITTGTATVNATTTLIDFSGVTIPDGVVGCYFQKIGDATRYIISAVNSATQITLDSAFVGTLSAGSYTIFTDESRMYNSEWRDFDAWGMATELRRNSTMVGGRGALEPVTGHAVTNSAAYVFTLTKIYRLTSSKESRFQPAQCKLIFDGIGSVGGRAVVVVEDTIYFMSVQGAYRYRPEQGKPEYIGDRLGKDWLDTLINTDTMNGILARFCPGLNTVKFDVPSEAALATINDMGFVYDSAGQWWKETGKHPLLGWNDYDASGRPCSFYAQGAFLVQDDSGTNDGLPTSCTKTGTLTSATTLSATDTTAAFTATSGLKERYVHFYSSDGATFIGKRKISSNSGTVLNWTTALAGLAAGCVYHVAPVSWYHKSKDYYIPGKTIMCEKADILYYNMPVAGAPDGQLISTKYSDDTVRLNPMLNVVGGQLEKNIDFMVSGYTFALKIASPKTDAVWGVRDLEVGPRESGDNK